MQMHFKRRDIRPVTVNYMKQDSQLINSTIFVPVRDLRIRPVGHILHIPSGDHLVPQIPELEADQRPRIVGPSLPAHVA